MLKGAIGLKSIFTIVLSFMALSLLISVSSVGSLGNAIFQGFDNIDQYTDLTTEVDDKETLSDLTMFVRDRAVNNGCNAVEAINNGDTQSDGDPRPESEWRNKGEGYPGLKGTRLTQYPECFGGDSSAIRGDIGVEGEDDQQMPGIYSRERFEFTDNVTISTTEGEYWIEESENIMDITTETRAQYQNFLDDIEGEEVDDIGGGIGSGVWNAIGGAFDGFGEWIQRRSLVYNLAGGDGPETAAAATTIFLQSDDLEVGDRSNLDQVDPSDLEDLEIKAQFCEGDKGYIQGSRGEIDSDEGVTNAEPVYPIIVVEESKYSNCGDTDYDFEEYEGPYQGTQIYVHESGTSTKWPNVFEFRLNEDGNEEKPNYGAGGSPNLPLDIKSDSCQIYYQSGGSDHFRNYDTGILIDSQQNGFTNDEGLYYKEEHSSSDLPSRMSLNGETISDPETAGELRPQTPNTGSNELYGDLLCAPTEDGSESEWHMCHPESTTRDEIEFGEFTYSCNEDDWIVNPNRLTEVTDSWNYPESSESYIESTPDGISLDFQETNEDSYVSWENSLYGGWSQIETRIEINDIGQFDGLKIGESDENEGLGVGLIFANIEEDGEQKKQIRFIKDSESTVIGTWSTDTEYTVEFVRQLGGITVMAEGDSIGEGDAVSNKYTRLRDFRIQDINYPQGSSSVNIEAEVKEVSISP